MKILLVPQVDNRRIIYDFKEHVIKVSIGEVEDTFDFSGVTDGVLRLHDHDTGENLIKTTLSVVPIISAEKREGILYLELLNWIGEDASREERFPEWIDVRDYVAPEIDSGLDARKSLTGALKEEEVLSGKAEIKDSELEDWGDF